MDPSAPPFLRPLPAQVLPMPKFVSPRRLAVAVLCLAAALGRSSSAGEAKPLPLHQQIDRAIDGALPQWKLKRTADVAGDEEFLRRVMLDLVGVIPTAAEVRAFTSDRAADKRTKLIDRLLASDEHARHMAVVFDVMLMERRADDQITTADWRNYLADSFRRNKPLDALVREILSSDGVDPATRPAAKFFLDREAANDVMVRDISRLLLGVDLQCAQCHDHPTVEDYRHRHYYGLQTFVAGTKLFRQPGSGGVTILQEELVREVSFSSVFNPDKSQKTGPRLMDGPAMEVPAFAKGEEYAEKPSSKAPAVPKFSLRQALSKTLPRAETPEFSRNMANRLWAHLMGRGLVHPLDMHHSGNPPSHPELLKLLADELVALKFDTRRFLRELALSRTYQRSSVAPQGISPDEVPEESFALGNLKGLGPEQMFASVVRATGNEATLEREIEEIVKAATKPVEKEGEATEKPKADDAALQKARAAERAKRVAEFVELFGSPAGTAEGEFQASLPQALFLANGTSIVGWLAPKDDNLTARLLKQKQPAEIADEVYLAILSRRPAEEETKMVDKHLTATADRTLAVEQLVWSLLSSAEFRLNH